MKKTSVISGLALVSLVAMSSTHAKTPFDAKLLPSAHQNKTKTADAKCGDGKCGDTAKKSSKVASGMCGTTSNQANKKTEAKCGEGKCG